MTFDLTVGSDPEFCLFDLHKNRISSALNYLPNGKEDKIDLGDNYRVYSDNVLGEGEIPPARSGEELVNNFTELFKRTTQKLIDRGLRLMVKAAHDFPEEDLQVSAAKAMGCSISYCALEVKVIEPKNLNDISLRTQGGHCHIGRTDYKTCAPDSYLLDPWSKVSTIRALDRVLGVTMTYCENDPSAPKRKQLYGRAGDHRICVYGCEYRVLGNYWVSRPELVFFVDQLIRHTVKECSEDPQKYLNEYDFSEVRDIINSGDQDAALNFMKRELPKNFVKEAKSLKKLRFEPFLDITYKL